MTILIERCLVLMYLNLSPLVYRQWEDAFRGLYYSFRQQTCTRFYYSFPFFTVLWR